jgi:hypothetical protein
MTKEEQAIQFIEGILDEKENKPAQKTRETELEEENKNLKACLAALENAVDDVVYAWRRNGPTPLLGASMIGLVKARML